MSKETERALEEWNNSERDTEDDLHHHFEDFGRWYWCEISDEARRVYNLMFDGNVEDDSPLDWIWTAAAAQAYEGAFAAVAACLGVDPRAFGIAVAPWYENQDELPESISPETLMNKISEGAEWLRELENGQLP